MRDMVEAETFSPSTGASTDAALRVESPKQKHANNTLSTDRHRRA